MTFLAAIAASFLRKKKRTTHVKSVIGGLNTSVAAFAAALLVSAGIVRVLGTCANSSAVRRNTRAMSPSSKFVSPRTWSQEDPAAQASTSAATGFDKFTGASMLFSNCNDAISEPYGSKDSRTVSNSSEGP
jgi:hypothetical protein